MVLSARRPSAIWFWLALGAIAVSAGIVRGVDLAAAWRVNPLAKAPLVDAMTYWRWGSDIATGKLIGGEPFFSAPLYPYLLGGVIRLGGGLATLYGIQVAMYVLTIVMVGVIGRHRGGTALGLLAALLYALLLEPAYLTGRVLNSTVQALVVCLAWWAMLQAQQRPAIWRWLLVGFLLGISCLTNPTMLLAIPIIAIWAGALAPGTLGRRTLAAAAVALAALVAISPATFHNYRASQELIPISSQSGITFYQGNCPGAFGVYTPVSGISGSREFQNQDARKKASQALGHQASWRETDRYFRQAGLDYWLKNPGAALLLPFQKLTWFVSSRYYSDIYFPEMERAAGLARGLWAQPIPTAWITLPGLLGATLIVRRWRRWAPELVLLGVPLLTVLLFWYSSRYRFPAVPVLALLTAHAFCELSRRTRPSAVRFIAPGATLASIGLSYVPIALSDGAADRMRQSRPGAAVAALWRDRPAQYEAYFHENLGSALFEVGRFDDAQAEYEKALAANNGHLSSFQTLNLAGLYLQKDDPRRALDVLQRALKDNPQDGGLHDRIGLALVKSGRLSEARAAFERAVALSPESPRFRNNLGSALRVQKQYPAALAQFRESLRLSPSYVDARMNLALTQIDLGDPRSAARELRAIAQANPSYVRAWVELSGALWSAGEASASIDVLREGLKQAPDEPDLQYWLAWRLSSQRGLPAASRGEALAVARKLATRTGGQNPLVLDVLAMALAANGEFDGAVEAERHAVEVLRAGAPASASLKDFEARRALYADRRPFVAEPPERLRNDGKPD